MINTYNESSLHRTIKNMLSKENSGNTEVEIHGYICDIVCKDFSIIEIQTKNLGNLHGKIEHLLEHYTVTLVYPLPITTYIEYYNEGELDKKALSRRKSPFKKNIYNIFDEVMGCFSLLLNDKFTLKVLEVSITKERIKTKKRVQSANKKRRILKDWISHDTTLDEIFSTRSFKYREDYLSLLPKGLKNTFCVTDIIQCKNNIKISKQQAYKMIWTFNKMGLIEYIGKDGRNKMYRIINN